MATPRRETVASATRGSIFKGRIAERPAALHDLPPAIAEGLRDLHRADTLARFKIAREKLAAAIDSEPDLAHLLKEADLEFERRLAAIADYRNEHA